MDKSANYRNEGPNDDNSECVLRPQSSHLYNSSIGAGTVNIFTIASTTTCCVPLSELVFMTHSLSCTQA